jgi:hypothetical protein
MWWSKTSPSASWEPTYGTSVSPLPASASSTSTSSTSSVSSSTTGTTRPTPAPTTPPGATRNYWDHPGGDLSVWNTPFGDNAIWGDVNDADTRDLRHGGYINTVDNYGEVIWVCATFLATLLPCCLSIL